MSIILGVVGWALTGPAVLVMWLSIRASAFDPDPSGRETTGFLPPFALMFTDPVNLTGGVIGIVGVVGRLATRRLN